LLLLQYSVRATGKIEIAEAERKKWIVPPPSATGDSLPKPEKSVVELFRFHVIGFVGIKWPVPFEPSRRIETEQ